MDEYLTSIYYDPKQPASYAGPTKLYKVVKAAGKKITLRQIREWLKGQETYTLHRQARRRFPRSRVIVGGLNSQADADLMDVGNLSKYNDGVKFVLVLIDIFSRFCWLEPLKSKQGVEVASAFKRIFDKGRIIGKIRSDRGTEFSNKIVDAYLRSQGVEHFVTNNEVKANYAERLIKTIKGRIFKYFTKKQTYHYVTHLQDFADSYNHTYHRSIKMKPVDVNESNEGALWEQQYGMGSKQPATAKPFKFAVGDTVRISYLRTTFMREYQEKWTDEIFTIKKRYRREGLPIYELKDYQNEDVQGTFYEQEIQLVDEPEVYKIENILRSRKVKGKKQHLVRWSGWSSKYDSWIDAKELEAYK